MNTTSLGQIGEKTAANYLLAQGYEILEANYFNHKGYRIGEIDLVAKDKEGSIVFVEVKCRKGSPNVVVPAENVTPQKIRKIIKAANYYLSKHELVGSNWRIDLVAIVFDYQSRKLSIRHIKAIRL